MSSYKGLRKSFELSKGHSKITKVDEIVNELSEMQKTDEIVSIIENKVGAKKVVITIVQGSRAGALKDGISAADAVSFIGQATGKNLIRQRATGLHRALNEKNLEECYDKALQGIATIKGVTTQQLHEEFCKLISIKMGETKIFNADALTALHAEISGKNKSAASKDVQERVALLARLQDTVVRADIIGAITRLGHDSRSFIEDAKKHHFVFYPNRNGGSYRLAKGGAVESFDRIKKNKATSEQVSAGIITYDPSRPHLITDTSALPEGSKETSFTIASGRRGTRGEDQELKASREFLSSKGFTEETLNSLTIKAIKKQAQDMGFGKTPTAV